MGFFESRFLWLDVVIAAAFAGAATGVVGVHAKWRRVVFLPAALSQLAGLGAVCAFLIAHLFDAHEPSAEWPRAFALLFASGGALLLGLGREGKGTTREGSLAAVYVASGALILLLGSLIPQELHDVSDILFGNAITLDRGQMISTAIVCTLILVVHAGLGRPFTAVAFDAETAAAHGVPVRRLDALVFLTMGIAAATCTRVVGAAPTFAFAVFPAMCGTALARDPRWVVAIAAAAGAASAFLGYWASFMLSLSTGASMAGVAAALALVARGASVIVGRSWRAPAARVSPSGRS